jgi:hypothetical protein
MHFNSPLTPLHSFPSPFSLLPLSLLYPQTNAQPQPPQLEELTEIFNAAKPVKYSLKKSEVVIHDGEGVGAKEVFETVGEKEVERMEGGSA